MRDATFQRSKVFDGLAYIHHFRGGGMHRWMLQLPSTSNSLFTNFNPTLRSNMVFDYTQPLLRNREIDSARQQLLVTRKNREISDVQFRETVVTTTRNVKSAYWDLAYAVASLAVSQQSLDLARQSLRNTRSRVEIGTMAPIDIVEPTPKVATLEEAVACGRGGAWPGEESTQVASFWTRRRPFLEHPLGSQLNPYQNRLSTSHRYPTASTRAPICGSSNTLGSSDINILYARNQTCPAWIFQVNYCAVRLGGTQFDRVRPWVPGVLSSTSSIGVL